MKYRGHNTAYNIVDTLMYLNPKLWNDLKAAFEGTENDYDLFVIRSGDFMGLDIGRARPTIYTYWDAFKFASENNYRWDQKA